MGDQQTPGEKFEQAARKLERDEDEARLDETVARITILKVAPAEPKPEPE